MDLFSESDLKEWKLKEEQLVQRFKNGYYRCKRKNSEVYEQICELYKPYITEEHLRQLHHSFSTQHSEAMNNSVSAFAPKGKTYSKTESLETRVAIAACVQILGYELFWELVYKDFGVSFDGNLRRNMDKKKRRKNELAQTNEKLTDEHKKDMAAQKEGLTYESAIAFKVAQRVAKQMHSHKERNPDGTPKKDWKCKYWHVNYCQASGHASSSSKQC